MSPPGAASGVPSLPSEAAAPAPVSWLKGARVRHWAHFLLLPLAGYEPRADLRTTSLALARGVVIAFAVLAFGYLLNGVSDRHMDGSARKNPLLAGTAHAYIVPLSGLAAVALFASLLAPSTALFATAVGLASGLVYSIGPRIKRYPVVGTLANATNFAPLLWVGLPSGAAAAGLPLVTLCFSCLLLQNQILHEAADRDDDSRGRVLTTYRLLGPVGSALLLALLGAPLVLAALSSPALSPFAVPLGLVYGLGFPAALARFGDDPRFSARARLAHRVASLVSGAIVFACLRLAFRY
jgi:4-hydroxybenzoate polyprenyltransferase